MWKEPSGDNVSVAWKVHDASRYSLAHIWNDEYIGVHPSLKVRYVPVGGLSIAGPVTVFPIGTYPLPWLGGHSDKFVVGI